MERSTSATDASPLSTRDMACMRLGTSRRFTMNPGVSRHLTPTFPILPTHSITSSNATASVYSVLTTSTSFMSCTGLKKCTPTNFSGRPDASAIWVMLSEDVFDAKTVEGLHLAPRSAYRAFFRSMFSMIASTIKSASFNASRSVVYVILPNRASASGDSSLPLDTSLSTDVCIRSRPRSRKDASDSYATMDEWTAAMAAVWAIPCPISPRPTTPNLSKVAAPPPRTAGVEERN
jgi:hypothetical protein